jgi:hypothetical protein
METANADGIIASNTIEGCGAFSKQSVLGDPGHISKGGSLDHREAKPKFQLQILAPTTRYLP